MKDLIEALTILLKYGNPAHPTHCEHDELTICGIDPFPEVLRESFETIHTYDLYPAVGGAEPGDIGERHRPLRELDASEHDRMRRRREQRAGCQHSRERQTVYRMRDSHEMVPPLL